MLFNGLGGAASSPANALAVASLRLENQRATAKM